MKCMHCGADLPEDQLICPRCGREIQIVPDYNPLDDMLTAQLKGGITQTMSLHLGEQEKQDVSYSGVANPVYERRESVGGETRCVGNSGSVGRRQQETVTRRGRDAVVRRSDVRPATGRVGQREDAREQTRRAYEEERRLRRMRAEKRKERARKKRRKMLLMLLAGCIVLAGLIFLFYQNSYTGKVKKGYRLLAGTRTDIDLCGCVRGSGQCRSISSGTAGYRKAPWQKVLPCRLLRSEPDRRNRTWLHLAVHLQQCPDQHR